MKKKIVAALMTAAMTVSLVACGTTTDNGATGTDAGTTGTEAGTEAGADAGTDAGADAGTTTSDDKTITIWVTELAANLTEELANQWIAENELDYTIVVQPVGEGDAATNMITDVQSGGDIFGFAQDQLSRLVSAGAIAALNSDMTAWVGDNNSDGSVGAAQVAGVTYAFPMTDDNGYFMYYDKSVVTDPTSLEQIVADCEAAGKSVYFDLDSAWYNAAFFFATGCTCEFTVDENSKFTAVDVDYASEQGIVALKEMIELASSPAFVDGSSVGDATNIGAIIDGNWDAGAAQTALGDNYAAAELPSFVGADGNTYHLASFAGVKLMGVKPQTDATKLAVCYMLAQYLTDYDAQLARFNDEGLQWGPSNVQAQAETSTEALSALAAQNVYSVPQGNYPNDWWNLAGAIGGSVESGEVTASSSDDELLALLQLHDDGCAGFLE